MSRTVLEWIHTLCLTVEEFLAQSRREIWRWSDCNWIPELSVRFRTKWFWVRVQLQSANIMIVLNCDGAESSAAYLKRSRKSALEFFCENS